MSIYLATSPDAPAFLASNTGWGAFSRWVQFLKGAPALARLCAYGWSDDIEEMRDELEAALSLAEDPDVKSVGAALLNLLAGAETAVITDGMNPNPDA